MTSTKQLVVLLSRQRSGTNALRSVLESHPKIHCFGEVMSYTDSSLSPAEHFLSFAKEQCGNRYDDPNNHSAIFEEFVEGLHGLHDKEITLIDVKYNSSHHFSARYAEHQERPLFNWIQEHNIPLIRLRRDNYLKVLLSDQVARLRDQWHDFSDATEGVNKPKVTNAVMPDPSGDMTKLLRRIKHWQLEDNIIDVLFAEYYRCCPVTYAEMFPELGCSLNEQVLHRISNFLEVEYDYDTTPWSAKSVPRPLWEVITNWQQVRDALTGTQYEHFLADEPMFQTMRSPAPIANPPVAFSTAADFLAKVASK